MSESSASPYETHRGTELWKIVDKAVSDLVENSDIVETTQRNYIVGYLCQSLQGHFRT